MGILTKNTIDNIFSRFGENIEEYKTFIETGTHLGATCLNVNKIFEKIYTIEISPKYFSISNSNFRSHGVTNVFSILGDSTHVLPKLLDELNENLVFWLDGHWSMGDTGKGEKQSPLLEECASIVEYCKNKNKKSVIMIDDVRIFGIDDGKTDWKDITTKNINSIVDCIKVDSYIENDIFFIFVDGSL